MSVDEVVPPGGSVDDVGAVSQPAEDTRVGASWSMDEAAEMVQHLRTGSSVEELAALLGRTSGGIRARLARMIPAEEHVYRSDAANWLIARFAAEPDYDWRAVLADRLAQRQPRTVLPTLPIVATSPADTTEPASSAPKAERARPVVVSADRVREIWQDIVGVALQPARVEAFLVHPNLATIARYPEDRVRIAGEELYRRTGKLLLAQWVRECTWDGGGTAALTWDSLVSAETDAVIAVRDLIAAAIGGLGTARSRRIVTERLGLHGDSARTLHAIGADLDISRERVRQLQEQAFKHFRQRRQPPKPAQYVVAILAEVITQASSTGVELAHALSVIAEAVSPTAPTRVMIPLLAALTGRSARSANNLVAEVNTLRALRSAEMARAARDAATTDRARQRVDHLLADVDWPIRSIVAPERSLFVPQRSPDDREGVGTWPSKKLGRDVVYESSDERRMIRTFDEAPQVAWFCEQPVAISYTFDGRERTYYPDFLVATDDDRGLLVEVKPQLDMALAINLAKTAAARAFCDRHGWGYLCTDGNRSLRRLEQLPVPEPAERELATALRRDGCIMWDDTTAVRTTYAITGLRIAALVIQRRWDFRLGPYRIAEAGHAVRGHRRPKRGGMRPPASAP